MTSLASFLPRPRAVSRAPEPPTISSVRSLDASSPFGSLPTPAGAPAPLPNITTLAVAGSKREPPAYGSAERAKFVPRAVEDFGDGGAFPEIHIMQYPLNMGKKESSTAVVPLTADAQGNLQFDALVKQGSTTKNVYANFSDLVEKHLSDEQLAKPSEEDVKKTAERTAAALGKIIDGKIAAAQQTHIKREKAEPVYVSYTPVQALADDSHNSGSKKRLMRIQEMPVDPMEPPKFKHQKIPNGPGSPPVPVLHSPPRKLTVEDQKNWQIPPCISNWKNIKGYTIPLDKRMTSDGRGLQEVQVNSKFAKLSESLYIAEREARKDIEAHAELAKQMAKKQKQMQEETLRSLAAKAREEMSGKGDEREAEDIDEETLEKKEELEAVRRDRRRDIRRDMRMEHMGQDLKKKSRAARDAERDVSEKIALGEAPKQSADAMFDQRLFNQEQGLGQGFGDEEDYNLYNKPLFKGSSANQIYRPKKDADSEAYGGSSAGDEKVSKLLEKTGQFKPDRDFAGAADNRGKPRDKPVEFERDESDPFGMGDLYETNQKTAKKRTLDAVGKHGSMAAGGGGGDYSRRHDSSRTMEFEESGSKRQRRD